MEKKRVDRWRGLVARGNENRIGSGSKGGIFFLLVSSPSTKLRVYIPTYRRCVVGLKTNGWIFEDSKGGRV